ncbi:MAG: NapC/NirT family cytochrome c [Candidatus Eisenbacteria bacterium]
MNDFFREFFRLVGRYRRGLFLTFLFCCLIGVAGMFASYHFSTKSGFCDNCHFEEPYVESWKNSSHAGVECNDCHMPNSFSGKMTRGLQAARATWNYWWGSHTKLPRAEIDDENCLQCHEARLLEGPIEFVRGILFDHRHHMNAELRGMNLRCTSCHSQIVQGAHMEVTKETCFLCHFKGLPRGEAISGCACHDAPEDIVIHEGFRFKHAEYLTLGVVCEECHVNVTPGTGEVPKATCMKCHNARLGAYEDELFMHRKHVVEHSVDCADCHEPLGHRDVALVRSLETSCASCHGNQHYPQRDIFMGIGAEGVDPYPSLMFKAQVGCDGCHREGMGGTSAPPGGQIAKATGQACVMCHGRGFDVMLEEWRESVDDYLRRIDTIADEARGAWRGAGSAAKERVRAEYERAEKNLGFLREGRGEHNLVYTKLVLLKIQEDYNEVLAGLRPSWRERTPLTFAEQDLRGNCTKSCHANLKRAKIVRFEGIELTHNDHVYKHNLACTFCHDNSNEHGAVKLKRENCIGCHHTQESRACSDCHTTQRKMIRGVGGFGLEETPAIMADLGCADCHVDLHGGNHREATLVACVDCHEEGYDEMVDAWQDDTRSRVKEIQEQLADFRRLETTARSRGLKTDSIRQAEKLRTEAQAHLEIIRNDRSTGVHNTEFASALLDKAEKFLDQAKVLIE